MAFVLEKGTFTTPDQIRAVVYTTIKLSSVSVIQSLRASGITALINVSSISDRVVVVLSSEDSSDGDVIRAGGDRDESQVTGTNYWYNSISCCDVYFSGRSHLLFQISCEQ